jgi:predicted nucleic acid-binding protein
MILVDTNILARSAQPEHSQYPPAVAAIEILRFRSETLCLVPQVHYEYWVVATRPVEQNGLGMTADEAAADIVDSVKRFRLFRDERAILDAWLKLVWQYKVIGKGGHDARLVAAMERHNISRILTFNTSDFRRFPGIVVLDPLQVAAGDIT